MAWGLDFFGISSIDLHRLGLETGFLRQIYILVEYPQQKPGLSQGAIKLRGLGSQETGGVGIWR